MAVVDNTRRLRAYEKWWALLPESGELVGLLPAAGVLLTWTLLLPGAGGFAPQDHLPAGLALLGLLGLAMFGARRLVPADRHLRAALGCFGGFVAWNFVSILWSDSPGDAWEASDLLLVTLLSSWILALAPWRARTAMWLFVGFGLAVAGVCAITLVSSLDANELATRFTAARYNQPLDYPNTSAALTLVGLIPLLVVSARPSVPVWVSAPALALASFVAGFGLLSESRGFLLGAAIAFAVMLLVSAHRWRLALRMGVIAVGLVALNGATIAVYDHALDDGKVSGPLHHAAAMIAAVTGAALLVGLVLGLVEARLGDTRGVRRWGRRAGVVVGVVAIVGAAGLAATHAGSIKQTARDQWHSMKHPGGEYAGKVQVDSSSSNRLGNTNPRERYDYWRVSLNGFRADPIGGMGAGGFQHRYTIERRYAPFAKYPHNLVMSVIGNNGIVGVLLLLGLAGAVVPGVLRGRRDMAPDTRVVVVTALGIGVYFFVHAELDWLEAYPVLTGPALGFLMVAIAVRRGPQPAPARRTAHGATFWGPLAVVAVLAGCAVVSLALPWVSVRYTDQARSMLATSPAAGYADLQHAADANPLDDEPLTLLGTAALVHGDRTRSQTAFQQALQRESSYLPHLGLALIAQENGDHATAVREAQRSLALNNRSPQMHDVVRKLEAETSQQIDVSAYLREALTDPVYYSGKTLD